MSKGDTPRPIEIPIDEFRRRWEKAFSTLPGTSLMEEINEAHERCEKAMKSVTTNVEEEDA